MAFDPNPRSWLAGVSLASGGPVSPSPEDFQTVRSAGQWFHSYASSLSPLTEADKFAALAASTDPTDYSKLTLVTGVVRGSPVPVFPEQSEEVTTATLLERNDGYGSGTGFVNYVDFLNRLVGGFGVYTSLGADADYIFAAHARTDAFMLVFKEELRLSGVAMPFALFGITSRNGVLRTAAFYSATDVTYEQIDDLATILTTQGSSGGAALWETI